MVFMFGQGKWMDGETIFFSVSVGCAERAFRPLFTSVIFAFEQCCPDAFFLFMSMLNVLGCWSIGHHFCYRS